MDIRKATEQFEEWLGQQVKLNDDLASKHEAMREKIFPFMRATYYRWAQQFPELNKNISNAPEVLAVGDLHIENFGVWRDDFGRLAWGVNDFDESFHLPYTNDLVRLATSAMLGKVDLDNDKMCDAIVSGYRKGLKEGGMPLVVDDQKAWIKPVIHDLMKDADEYWEKLFKLPRIGSAPKEADEAIRVLMPPSATFEVCYRDAGLGSKGKPRFTAVARWMGGPLAREAKALTQSSAAWALEKSAGPHLSQIVSKAIRSHDPMFRVHGKWTVRRLAADCRRINIDSFKDADDRELLFQAMGFETANVHLGSENKTEILDHLSDLSPNWLKEAGKEMFKRVEEDFEKFR